MRRRAGRCAAVGARGRDGALRPQTLRPRRCGKGAVWDEKGRSAQHTLHKYTIRRGIVDLVGVEHLRKTKGALYDGLLVPRLGAFRAELGASVQLRPHQAAHARRVPELTLTR